MFFMFKICVNGERDKYNFLIFFLLHFCAIFCFVRRESLNLSKNIYLPLILTGVVTKNKQNIPQEGKVTFFKPRINKVILGQTTRGFSVITQKENYTGSSCILN